MSATAEKPVAVLIPVYKTSLDPHEAMALAQCVRILGSHPIIAMVPDGLKVDYLDPSIEIRTFDPRHFRSAWDFSGFQLTPEFHAAFADYRHVLMCQLDAYVFRDELLAWCARDFDYIGAPWPAMKFLDGYRFRKTFPLWMKLRWLMGFDRGGLVGNGGFSLRKVSACAEAIERLGGFAAAWPCNEDRFWGIAVPNFIPGFRIPPVNTALEFAFECDPRESFRRNANRLPFGCHAWQRYDPDFWQQYIRP